MPLSHTLRRLGHAYALGVGMPMPMPRCMTRAYDSLYAKADQLANSLRRHAAHDVPLSPDDRLRHLLQAEAMRNYDRAHRTTWYSKRFDSFGYTMFLFLAFTALALIGLRQAQCPRENPNPPITQEWQNARDNNTSASCAHICTSFDLLSLPAPAHPHILWLTSRAPDYAPDWLHALPHGWPLATLARTSSVVPSIWRTNRLADQVRAEASQFVAFGLVELLNRCVESFDNLERERESQSPFHLYLSHYTLLPELALPDERESLRTAMAWANDTAGLDRLLRLRDAVSSGLSDLRTTIADGVAHIDHSIALGRGPWDHSCHNATECKHDWQHDLDYLRSLISWTHFVELNVLTSSHIIDAMAFFTRYLSGELDSSSIDVAVVREAYSKKLHYIGHRAGLYAARQWALDHLQTSQNMVKACGTCFTNTSAWHSWWQPYEHTIPSTPLNVLEPRNPILFRTRFHGRSQTGRGSYPITAPPDFRKYKPALIGEQCLGIDHIWGDERLDGELEASARPRPRNDAYTIDSHALHMGLDVMWGKVWCISKARLIQNPHLGLLEPAESYALRWVKAWPQRRHRRTFVHEAWDAD